MAKKVVVLVDGQNLFYSLREIGIKEKDVKWNELFTSFLEKDDELVRSYWFRPQRLHEPHFDINTVTRDYIEKNHSDKKEMWINKEAIPPEVYQKIEHEHALSKKFLEDARSDFKTGEYKYDQLAYNNTDIEIVKAGVVKIDVFERRYIGEKGVDVSLCVKMLELVYKQKCDKIILISGDFDTSEAVKAVKDEMKKVHIVKFHKGYPPQNKTMSKDLSILADKILDVYEKDLRTKFLNTKP